MTIEKIRDTIGLLSEQLTRGWAAYIVAKSLHEAYQNNQITSARFLFTTTYDSTLETAVLSLSKLFLQNQDSVTIEYLLNLAEQNASLFPYSSKETVLKTVREHRESIAKLTDFRKILRTQRDQIIAHLDKLFVNSPSSISEIPELNLNEVGEVYKKLLKVVNVYMQYLEDSELYLSNLDDEIPRDLTYLLELIEEDNERVE